MNAGRGTASVFLSACIGVLTLAAGTAQAFPDRAVTIINAYPPGGATDVVMRPLAAALEPILGQPVVIENKPGAGGAVGAAYAAGVEPDGHTMLAHITSISHFPAVDELFGRTPNYTTDDFIPVARVAGDPLLFLTHADNEWQTVDEFVNEARERPNELLYVSSGLYGVLHVATEQFLQAADGLELRHLPGTGGASAIKELLGKNVQVAAAPIGPATPQVEAGNFRVLAVFGDERLDAFPDAPTLQELGYPVQYFLWQGLFVPDGTPQEHVEVLREAVAQAVEDPAFIEAMKNANVTIAYLDQPEFAEFWAEDARKIRETIEEIGIVQ